MIILVFYPIGTGFRWECKIDWLDRWNLLTEYTAATRPRQLSTSHRERWRLAGSGGKRRRWWISEKKGDWRYRPDRVVRGPKKARGKNQTPGYL